MAPPDEAPHDAHVVGYTWEHPNISGSPDRRFRTNRQLPICRYEAVHVSSPNGVNGLVEFSRTGVGQPFAAAVASLAKPYQRLALGLLLKLWRPTLADLAAALLKAGVPEGRR